MDSRIVLPRRRGIAAMSGLGWEVLGGQGGLRPFISGSYGLMIGMECIPRRNRNERIIMSSDGVPDRPYVFNNSSHVHLNVLSEKSGGHLRAELKSSLGFQCAFLSRTRRLHHHSSPLLPIHAMPLSSYCSSSPIDPLPLDHRRRPRRSRQSLRPSVSCW